MMGGGGKLVAVACWASGIEGRPLPYVPQLDDSLAFVLLCCFFVSAFVLSRCRKYLYQQAKDFLTNRERTSIFATSTVVDGRYLLLLAFQTCVLTGVYLFCVFTDLQPDLIAAVPSPLLLGLYIGLSVVYLALKWAIYLFLGWIFFDENRTSVWLDFYATLIYYVGFVLFPTVLFVVYFNLSAGWTVIIGVILLLLIKILMFYKWLKLFCINLYGVLYLILYFCALELMPCLVIYRALVVLNESMIIKI